VQILEGGQYVARLTKRAAGRLLDGRTWDEMPEGVAR
jgi:protein gp37